MNPDIGTARPRIAVCGPHDASPELYRLAEEVGAEIARRGGVVVCGGLSGVMEAAARGAKQAGGLTIGILPTTTASSANAFIDGPIVTGMGEARNVIIVRTAQALIAIGGAYGTLSEIALALRNEVPVIGLATWTLKSPTGQPAPILPAQTASEAVALAWKSLSQPAS
jgi:uncharacterized protein (TIGR00725 family)